MQIATIIFYFLSEKETNTDNGDYWIRITKQAEESSTVKGISILRKNISKTNE